jgi:hypothetical protein
MNPWNSNPWNMNPWNSNPWNSNPWNMNPWNSPPWNSNPWNSNPWIDGGNPWGPGPLQPPPWDPRFPPRGQILTQLNQVTRFNRNAHETRLPWLIRIKSSAISPHILIW